MNPTATQAGGSEGICCITLPRWGGDVASVTRAGGRARGFPTDKVTKTFLANLAFCAEPFQVSKHVFATSDHESGVDCLICAKHESGDDCLMCAEHLAVA